jgi:Family of unknown function (DUF6683)
MNLFRSKDGNSTNHKFHEHALFLVASVQPQRLASTQYKIRNAATSHLRNSADRLPMWRGLLLIPLVLVWFGRSDYANAYDDMGTLNMYKNQLRYQDQIAAAHGLPRNWRERVESSQPASPWVVPSNPLTYQPMPVMREAPIQATDFKPVRAPFAPDEIARSTPGLTPKDREQMAAELYRLFDVFNLLEGTRKNNLAHSYAFLVGISLEIVFGKEVSESEIDQYIRVFNNNLANNPQFATMPAISKQLQYEVNLIFIGWLAVLHSQNDVQAHQQARQMARGVLREVLGIETLP